MTPSEGILSHKLPYKGTTVIVSNGIKLPISHVGQSALKTSAPTLLLKNVLQVNLLSV